MKNILVAIDFEPQARLLIDYALTLSEKFSAKLWIVHIAAPNPDFVGYEAGPQYLRDMRAEELREEHQHLRNLGLLAQERGIEAEALLIQGPTVKMILEEAQKLAADLIVVGAHDHSFLHTAFTGNTALSLFKKTKIPLLAIPLADD